MRKKLAIIIAAVLIIGGGGVLAHGHFSAFEVDVHTVQEETVQKLVTGTGHLAGEVEEEIGARHSMVVQEVTVDAGDRVEPGDVLARGDTGDYEVEKKNLLAERDILRDEIANAKQSLPARLRGAESSLEAARENLREAEEDAETLKKLYESGAAAEKEYRQARLLVTSREAEVTNAEAAVQEIRTKDQQLSVQARRVDALQDQIDSVRDKIAQHEITAGSEMLVGEKLVSEGDVVAAGTPLFLLHSETMLVQMDVLAQDARNITVGDAAIVSGDAVGDADWEAGVSKVYPRAVERVSELGVRQRRVPVELKLQQMPDGAQPGYPVDVDIVVQQQTGLAIDRDAVFELDNADHVFVVRDDVAQLTEIVVALEGDDLVLVQEGLSAGDSVVVNPPAELDDAARVRINK